MGIRNISSFRPFKQEPNGITAKYWIKVDKRAALYKESKYPSELKEIHDRIEANKIECAKKLFNIVSTSGVKYDHVDSFEQLKNVIGLKG